ncbi:hypothetical protein ACFFUB_15305 [Algimonas porphyrae]|uniref:Antibiotic biosynthesis monooxygenase n=1 Tax=Algimonas porphyrae TaxID=1128113 RepID=A0ABQ5UYI6_9PROT|nr:hypothetical protein [Algimonas porphyrae]GLQ19795.1 hypothetical protein GCM10007854_07500 [Algimonas porphyrae]
MYCIVYRFKLSQPSEDTAARFVETWSGITDYLKRECDAMGSRLHQGEEGVFFAYAQWPSLDVFEASAAHEPKLEFVELRLDWAELCEPSEVVFAGEMLADLSG